MKGIAQRERPAGSHENLSPTSKRIFSSRKKSAQKSEGIKGVEFVRHTHKKKETELLTNMKLFSLNRQRRQFKRSEGGKSTKKIKLVTFLFYKSRDSPDEMPGTWAPATERSASSPLHLSTMPKLRIAQFSFRQTERYRAAGGAR